MAGHSKWANIKHRKGRVDARRAKVFAKLIKEITVAARLGSGDMNANPRLRLAIEKAKAESMPKENIERAIKRGTGEIAGTALEAVSYEGYGPAGVAIMVEGTTDNKNRTVAEIRNIFTRHGGNLGEGGSVAWMFERKGQIRVEAARISEETLFEKAIEAGAEDIRKEDGFFVVATAFEDFSRVTEALKGQGVPVKECGLEMVPKNLVTVDDEEKARKVLALMDALEDHDDVLNVWANFDIDEALLERIEA